MSERTCGNCRLYDGNAVSGACRRYAPRPVVDSDEDEHFVEWPRVFPEESCGEWADKNITPEHEERRELVRRFAVAIVSGDDEATGARYKPSTVWMMAEQLADAEPKSGGAR